MEKGNDMKNKTDLRVIKTKKALCAALMELLEEKRFDAVTVQELCDRAMVRRATFYKHFYDKYDFWRFFIQQTRREFMQTYPDCTADESLQQHCLYWFHRSIDFFIMHKMIVTSIVKSEDACVLIDGFSDEIYDNILKYLQDSKKIYPAAPTVIATFYAGGIVALLRRWFTSGENMSPQQAMQEFEKFILAFSL